jgi:hypothetical protein
MIAPAAKLFRHSALRMSSSSAAPTKAKYILEYSYVRYLFRAGYLDTNLLLMLLLDGTATPKINYLGAQKELLAFVLM